MRVQARYIPLPRKGYGVLARAIPKEAYPVPTGAT